MLQPFARIRLASSFEVLDVNIDIPLHSGNVSKNARRKAIRYGKALPSNTREGIEQLIGISRYFDS